MSVKAVLFVALGVFVLLYAVSWIRLARGQGVAALPRPTAGDAGIGFVTNFFDTLGIGSFATTTSIWKFLRTVSLVCNTMPVAFARLNPCFETSML